MGGIRDWLRFAREFLRYPRQIGAVAPSSKAYCKSITDMIPKSARVIVELGAGTGVLTREMLSAKPNARIVVVELNHKFCELLRERFKNEKRLTVLEGSATQLRKLLSKTDVGTPDAIMSCLPFKSLPKDTTNRVLAECRKAMEPESVFLALQYTKKLSATFERYFRATEWHRYWRNIPPSYTLEARAKQGE